MLSIPNSVPFSYDLGIRLVPSKDKDDEITICCHGYGHNNEIVDVIDSYQILSGHLIGFNFPDYGITSDSDHSKSLFGTINEILPLLYIIKYYACNLNIAQVNLYGFSAGAGAIINALAILHRFLHKDALKKIGIARDDVAKMLRALRQGLIILDCPLKSIEEIVALRGKTPELEIMASRYAKNNMNPIDVLNQLSRLNMNIILHFQNPDEILGNRDDALFIERLQKDNGGITKVIMGSNGGHNVYHSSLWKYVSKIVNRIFNN